jgi:hypothetical protein
LFYSETVAFREQIERYFHAFGREAVKVILYDDLLGRPAELMRATQEFLGVRVSPDVPLLRANVGRVVRSISIQTWLKEPPAPLRRVLRALMPTQTRDRVREAIARQLERFNMRGTERPVMDDVSLRVELSERFRPETERLSVLIDRDLSNWMSQPCLPGPGKLHEAHDARALS